MKGWLITLEGPEGAGKSTQIRRLHEYLESQGIPCMCTREPGGTAVGDRIREILLAPELTEMTLKAEVLLYAASRAQLVEEVIRPALASGKLVLCDRFVDSSIVYQGLGPEDGNRQEVEEINQVALGGLQADRTYLLDLSVEDGDRRLAARGYVDRMEAKGKQFHERVRQGFLALARENHQRIRVIDASQDEDVVFAALCEEVMDLIGKN
ncbi:dTMP kinase [Marininema halotolerans]|uniref:Thymidylate kinase n=1 Tax=Marininema halotolerans TaxID=1155944 RepID=A0A1I6TDL0_9BACL|nr:dTMP kinase [Marininema halotolerans]SFS87270.1 dTMP kinase [Marininema halotolerans]